MHILELTFLNNSLENWGIALIYVVASLVLARILYWVFSKVFKSYASKTKQRFDDVLVDMLEEPIVLAVVIIGLWWGYDHLSFSDGVNTWVVRVFRILVGINMTWMFVRLFDAMLSEFLIPYAKKKTNDSADRFLDMIRKSLRAIFWLIGIIVTLSNADYDVGALLAGLGIGGIAMAMAAKDFVANIFGGITVFFDKPFTFGDRIQVGGYDGMVQEIGIRSTKIKTLEGRIVIIPNHKFTDSYVENVSLEPTRKMRVNLGLTYDTSKDRIEEAIATLKQIVLDEAMVTDECLVWFSGFGDFSLNVSLIYYIKKEGDLIEVPNQINLAILSEFNQLGLDFAFPTQTILHKEAQ
jgi:MscS family membrane protein